MKSQVDRSCGPVICEVDESPLSLAPEESHHQEADKDVPSGKEESHGSQRNEDVPHLITGGGRRGRTYVKAFFLLPLRQFEVQDGPGIGQ